MTIIGSILMYPVKNMEYIDALFFASGACTQAGLNTIDINLLTTYQQLILFIIPMLTNPITINTFVVFLRLYWFEKRFQHIATEARRSRRTISKTRSQMKSERDIGQEEAGVNGRKIVVMHHTTHGNGITNNAAEEGPDVIHMTKPDLVAEKTNGATSGTSGNSSKGESSTPDDQQEAIQPAGHHPQIKFASRVTRSDGASDEPLQRMPQWTEHDHISVLERQRNPQDKGVLRIPGPRDADRGMAPEAVDEDEEINHTTSRRNSNIASRRGSESHIPPEGLHDVQNDLNDDQEPTRAIAINEPNRDVSHETGERARAAAHTLGIFKFRKPRVFTGAKNHEDENYRLPGTRSRRNSFSSFRISSSREKTDMTPYLSWQPTVGRNSAFVDLTEAQREELGGIEYRSLKSLALILVLYFWGWTIFGIVGLLPWILHTEPWGSIVDGDGISRVWWAFFSTNTSFNDVGFTLTPDSMISFNTAIWPLLLMSFLVIIGNTGFPVMLRGIIWIISKYVPTGSGIWEELRFLLDHPRRCFTLLFPSKATWWLFWILVILNGIDLIFFIVLDVSYAYPDGNAQLTRCTARKHDRHPAPIEPKVP
jgi:potassium uptake Trk family protein